MYICQINTYSILYVSFVVQIVFSQSYVYELGGRLDDGYAVNVSIGTPAQNIEVIIDTGSSNFAVAVADHQYIDGFCSANSTTFKDLNKNITLSYVNGMWTGSLGQDYIAMNGISTFKSKFTVIYQSKNFFVPTSTWRGILGLAFQKIAVGENPSKPDGTIKPMFDEMLTTNQNMSNSFSIQLCGTVSLSNKTMTGNITFGDLVTSQYVGDIYYAALVKEDFYQVTVTGLSVDSERLSIDCTEYNNPYSIVDVGTTKLRLPDNIFNEFVKKIQTAVQYHKMISLSIAASFWSGDDTSPGMACRPVNRNISESNHHRVTTIYDIFPQFSIRLLAVDRETEIELNISPKQYIRPSNMKYDNTNQDCYTLGVSKSDHGTVIGSVIMEGFLVSLNRTYKSVGFAKSSCPKQNKISAIKVSGYAHYPDTPFPNDCMYTPKTKQKKLPSYAVALIVIFVAMLLMFAAFCVVKLLQYWRHRRHRLVTEIDFQDLMHDTFDDTSY